MKWWPWVSRSSYDQAMDTVRLALDNAIRLHGEVEAEKAERKRLTDIIVKMRMEGFSLRPEDTDERWKGGSYVMEEEEQRKLGQEPERGPPVEEMFDEAELKTAAEVEAQVNRDFERIFKEED